MKEYYSPNPREHVENIEEGNLAKNLGLLAEPLYTLWASKEHVSNKTAHT